MLSRYFIPVIVFALCILSGCDNPLAGFGSSRKRSTNTGKSERRLSAPGSVANTPEGVFRGIWRACIDGRFADAHAMYSRRLQRVIPVSRIAATYGTTSARAKARRMLGGARFKVDHYAGNHAFARVDWPDNTSQDLTFVREAGRWKLDITPVKRR